MAGEIRASGFGFNDQSRTDRAMAGVIDAVRLQHCNCVEITGIKRQSFLGVSYTSLVAHARHIQKIVPFEDANAGSKPYPREWIYTPNSRSR